MPITINKYPQPEPRKPKKRAPPPRKKQTQAMIENKPYTELNTGPAQPIDIHNLSLHMESLEYDSDELDA